MKKILALGMLLLVCLAHAAGVRLGMSRLEVEAAIGKPTSVMQRGDKFVMVYPKGSRVELVNDRVVDMFAVQVEASGSTAAAVAKPAEELPEDAEERPVDPEQKTTAKDQRTVEQPESENEGTTIGESWTGLILQLFVGAVIYIAVVMVVLKLAFKWADVHADWGQMFIPALSDTIVRSIFDIVGAKFLDGASWFHLNDAVSYFVLLFVLMKTTHACTLVRAVAVAGAAKLMSIVVGGFIVALVLNALA